MQHVLMEYQFPNSKSRSVRRRCPAEIFLQRLYVQPNAIYNQVIIIIILKG
jgi:hypothetical protein